LKQTTTSWQRLKVNFCQPSWRARRALFLGNGNRLNFANLTDRLAELYGDRSALILDCPLDLVGAVGSILTYEDLAVIVRRVSAGFHDQGVRQGEPVALMASNRFELAIAAFAAARLGAVPIPLNAGLTIPEFEVILNRTATETVVCDEAVHAAVVRRRTFSTGAKRWIVIGDGPAGDSSSLLRDLASTATSDVPVAHEPSPNSTAIVLFTSGSTRGPRGAQVTHAAALFAARRVAAAFAISPVVPRGLSLLIMPLAHTSGLSALIMPLVVGIPTTFLSKFDPGYILDVIEQQRPTIIAGTPTLYRILLRAGAAHRDLSSIRILGGGGDTFSDDLVRTWRKAVAGKDGFPYLWPLFVRGYGMAEANSFVSLTPPFPCGDNCLGWVLPPTRYRIAGEDGEDVVNAGSGNLLLKGPTISSSYWNDPESSSEAFRDGWLHTGDIVRKGKWGMLSFVGRTDDIIKCGGYKVSAVEIDQVLLRHPDVEQAAAVGLPHEMLGEVPVAAIVMKAGSLTSPQEIIAWTRQRLAPYKCPRLVIPMARLPLTTTLKPLRRAVREKVRRTLLSRKRQESF
jgi:long-chain acyl-CoA synthetase